jgi:putative transposase
MRRTRVELYVHLVWGTWDRWPLITQQIRPAVYAGIQAQATAAKAEVIAIGGMEDHVHVLCRYPATIAIAELVKQLKGSTSHMVTHALRTGETFKWQGGYGAFSVSRKGVPFVRAYVLDQERHHRGGTLLPALECDSAS